MATTRQLLRILRLSLFLNLVHFSMSSQINSLHHSYERVLCPRSEFGGFNPYVPSVPGRGPVATVDSDIVCREISRWFPTCPVVSGLPIERCGADVPLMSTPQFVEMGWGCLHNQLSDNTCMMCFCGMFHTNHHLQDMVYALYEIYFGGGDAGRVIGEKMLGNIPLDQFVANPNPLSGVEILPMQRLNDLANINATKDMAWDILTCLRDSSVTGLSLTDEERKDVAEATWRWFSCYAQRLWARKDVEEANLQRWSSKYVQQSNLLPSIAYTRLTELSYTTKDLDRSPRIWIHQRIQYAKATGRYSYTHPFHIWFRFDPNLQRDIPMPNSTTTIIDLLEKVDEMYPTWAIRYQGSYGGCQHNAFRAIFRICRGRDLRRTRTGQRRTRTGRYDYTTSISMAVLRLLGLDGSIAQHQNSCKLFDFSAFSAF